MALTPQHTYQILTKRPERILAAISYKDGKAWQGKARLNLAEK